MITFNTFWETLVSLCGVRQQALVIGQSLARVKIWGTAFPYGRNAVSLKSPLGLVNITPIIFLLVDQSSQLFSPKVGLGGFPIFVTSDHSGDICDQSRSCQKSRRIFGRFCPPKFYWRWADPKVVHTLSRLPRDMSRGFVEKSRAVTPTNPKVIGTPWILSQILNIGPYIFSGNPRPLRGVR